jgi:hypothetical protein
MSPITKPCPADQAAPLTPGRSALADVALAFGIETDAVQAYVAHHAAFLSAPHRLVARCVELRAVGL